MKRLMLLTVIFFTGLIAHADLYNPTNPLNVQNPISPYNPLNPVSPMYHIYFPDRDNVDLQVDTKKGRYRGYMHYTDCITEYTPAYCRYDKLDIFSGDLNKVTLCRYYGGGSACDKYKE